jgi:penicillin-binding protein 2
LAGWEWRTLAEDERHPLSNRAIQGLYAPGSVFKLVTTAAGLESGSIEPSTVFDCLGTFWISLWPYKCWKYSGHGLTDLHRAIVESCDSYFYHVGMATKAATIEKYALDFGLGEAAGVDLPNEAEGLVPSAEWKEKTQHIPWFPGNTVMMAIGQGYLLATPLQLALMVSAFANGGSLYQPHLLKTITDPAGRILKEFKPVLRHQVNVKPETFRFIQEAMEDVVNTHAGTGGRARLSGITVAGKTGTAQNPHGPDNAQFVAFAPAEHPQVAVAVLVEEGGEGGVTAAPIAKKVMQAYFAKP